MFAYFLLPVDSKHRSWWQTFKFTCLYFLSVDEQTTSYSCRVVWNILKKCIIMIFRPSLSLEGHKRCITDSLEKIIVKPEIAYSVMSHNISFPPTVAW